jgi:hypothetical protein
LSAIAFRTAFRCFAASACRTFDRSADGSLLLRRILAALIRIIICDLARRCSPSRLRAAVDIGVRNTAVSPRGFCGAIDTGSLGTAAPARRLGATAFARAFSADAAILSHARFAAPSADSLGRALTAIVTLANAAAFAARTERFRARIPGGTAHFLTSAGTFASIIAGLADTLGTRICIAPIPEVNLFWHRQSVL